MSAEAEGTAQDRAIDALTKILESAISPDMLEVQQIILRRLAMSGDLFPSRVPPPLNITEVGGYLNLVQNDPVLSAQVLAAALGVAGPNPSPGFEPTLPPLYYVTVPNDRPAGSAQAATPVQLLVRSDLAPAFSAARDALHAVGARLPVLRTTRPLPPVAMGVPPPDDLLPYLGRVLELVPSAALVDPANDPLAVGQRGGAGAQLVVARQLDTSAPDASSVPAEAWSLWACDATQCTQNAVTGSYVEVEPLLNGAGWYQPTPPAAPVSSRQAGGWDRWTNVTGLVVGTPYAEELRLLHPVGTIAASSVRERLQWTWDGASFVPPS